MMGLDGCFITSDKRILKGTLEFPDISRPVVFQQDLHRLIADRLNVIPIHIPPLRERKEDIIPLARHQLRQIAQDASLSEIEIDTQAVKALLKNKWPGNARELTNVLERSVATLQENIIHLCDFPFYLYKDKKGPVESDQSSLKMVQSRAEKEAIRYALESANYNKARAAEMLGIHNTLLYKKMKKYNLPL